MTFLIFPWMVPFSRGKSQEESHFTSLSSSLHKEPILSAVYSEVTFCAIDLPCCND